MGSHEWTNVAALPTCHIDFVLAAVPKHEARSFVRPILHRLILRSATSMSSPLIYERNWADKYKYEDAEKQHFERLAKGPSPPANNQADEKSSLASEVARARQHIKTSLECVDRISTFAVNQGGTDLVNRIVSLEKENEGLRKLVEKMQKSQDALEKRLNELEKKSSSVVSAPKTSAAPAKPAAPQKAAPAPKDDDDDVDLFGSSDEEDESAKQVREQRLAEYAAKKSKKPALIAKSNVILDVKPWDDETDMLELEKAVRSIEMDGLLWGASKKVPLAYGIHKLQISAVIEDEKVSVDLLTEQIEANEDYVQSVDIAAFNKI
ncbi:Hypothetical predicted protein [Cloeon dipterum]|uniref:Translation elongation factor EF1B beta/delta subunit guanine nucleotide exchange domain-containing protein n=1 Tax=Cloeon dipterum TaxID=197152 RepID=A0A8S1CM23_9INSE|nr:Hypothetical predicted protein [Cloeon dipterum]